MEPCLLAMEITGHISFSILPWVNYIMAILWAGICQITLQLRWNHSLKFFVPCMESHTQSLVGQHWCTMSMIMAHVTNVMKMSNWSLWLLSVVLDFWEIIILKSAPTLHLIQYATFENLFFICFGSFSMFIEWYCIKRPFSSSLSGFLAILRCDSDFWTVFYESLFSAWKSEIIGRFLGAGPL